MDSYVVYTDVTQSRLDYFEKLRLHVVSNCLAGVDDDLSNCCSSDAIHVLQACERFTCCRTRY